MNIKKADYREILDKLLCQSNEIDELKDEKESLRNRLTEVQEQRTHLIDINIAKERVYKSVIRIMTGRVE